MIDRILLALLGGSVLSGGLVFAELVSSDSSPSEVTASSPSAVKLSPINRPKPPPSGELVTASLARPLFNATRRPAARANDAQAGGPDTAELRLTGVVIEADRHVAIFAPQGSKPFVRSEGETVNQWYVDQILPRQVVLSGPDGSLTLEMRGDPSLVRVAITKSRPEARGNAPAKPQTSAAESARTARPTSATAVQSQENVARGSSPVPAQPPRPAANPRNRPPRPQP